MLSPQNGAYPRAASKWVVLLGDLNGTMGGRAFAGITAQQLRGRRINKWRGIR